MRKEKASGIQQRRKFWRVSDVGGSIRLLSLPRLEWQSSPREICFLSDLKLPPSLLSSGLGEREERKKQGGKE